MIIIISDNEYKLRAIFAMKKSINYKKDTRNPRTFPFCHHGSILAFPDSWIYDIVSALAITITLVIVTTLDTNKQSALVSEAKTVRE